MFEPPRRLERRLRRDESLHEPQREVDPGYHPARGHDAAVIDHPCLRMDLCTEPSQIVERTTVRDRGAPTEQSGRRQQHRAGAHRCDHGPTLVELTEQARQRTL